MVPVKIDDLFNINRQIWLARTVIAAVELGLFELIGEKGATLEEVISHGELNGRGAKIILDALVPIGLLEHDDGRYTLTDLSMKHLIPGKPDYIGYHFLHMARLWKSWGDLPESVRTGKPYWLRHPGDTDKNSLVVLAGMLFSRNFAVSRTVAESLGAGKKWKGLRILDVAAGSGAWSLGFLVTDPDSRAVAIDFAHVLEMARQKAAEVGVADRFDTLDGNVREIDFGSADYDLAILGHICHSEGAENSPKLIARSAEALVPGGKLLIADMIPDDDRRGPLYPLLFAVNMLVNTTEGGTFTFAEYRDWCEAAGLKNVRKLAAGGADHSPPIIAEKPRN